MTDRDIRAHLRGAVKEKLICGWYFYETVVGYNYVVNPGPKMPISILNHDQAVDYCHMLTISGVEPLYRQDYLK